MPETFELFRLSLLKRSQKHFFVHPDGDPTREEYLREVFGGDHSFPHRGNIFHYVPAEKYSSRNAIIGRIGRKVENQENTPPEDGLEEVVHEGWKAIVIAIDPRHHEDGQKASVQLDSKIGKPFALLSALIHKINEEYKDAAYNIKAQPIFDAGTFWTFAERNKGKVTYIKFNFVVPNMFGTSENLSKELRSLGAQEGAERVGMDIANKEGLSPETERIKSSVDYAQKGGGDIKANAKGGKTYNSKTKTKRTSLRAPKGDKQSLLARVAVNIARTLGRD